MKSYKVALYSACCWTNGDYIRYFFETLETKKSDCDGEELEMFSVSIEVVEAVLFC